MIALIGVVWLYVLHDYGGWQPLRVQKHRDRVIQAARLTLFCHGGIVSSCYGLRVMTGGQPLFGENTALPITLLYLVFGNFLLTALLYRWADHIIAKRGKLDPRRVVAGGTDDGYPVHRPNLGSGHYY